MAMEFTTRDLFEQVDARLQNVEQELRAFRSEMHAELVDMRSELRSELRSKSTSIRAAISTQGRWICGTILASWLSVIASLWLKP